jgi:hypothetical protein
MQQFNQFAGSLAGAGLGYAINGEMTLNVLNFGFLADGEDTALNRVLSTGLLELHLGQDGATMNLGTGGLDVSIGTVATAMAGLAHWGESLEIKEAAKRDTSAAEVSELAKKLGIGEAEARKRFEEGKAVALRGAYGFGDETDLAQLDSVKKGGTVIHAGEKNETVAGADGVRTVTLAGLMGAVTDEQRLALAVALSHEARRDGVVTADNNIETRGAVTGHTEMAVRMRAAGYNIAADPLIALDLAVYDYAKSAGDMSLMDLYADTLYRSEGGDFMDVKDLLKSSVYDLIEKNLDGSSPVHGIASAFGAFSVSTGLVADMANKVVDTSALSKISAVAGATSLALKIVETAIDPNFENVRDMTGSAASFFVAAKTGSTLAGIFAETFVSASFDNAVSAGYKVAEMNQALKNPKNSSALIQNIFDFFVRYR